MTHIIQAANVNMALPMGIEYLKNHGIVEQSRNGAVLVAPGPVVTEYLYPMERVLFDPLRDANPFFHLLESLWMLAGRNDVKFPAHYAANIASFSDDGVTIAGAYGERWRERFGTNQLTKIIEELKRNPQSRRCVLSMWDPYGCPKQAFLADPDQPRYEDDLYLAMNGGKDVPCNTHIYFDTIGGGLNMTVCCRSNDMVWGAYGANVVHFSFLHEFVARSANLQQGVYRQFSNNFHAYIERPDTVRLFDRENYAVNPYDVVGCGGTSYPLMSTDQQTWELDLHNFFDSWDKGHLGFGVAYRDPFFKDVVLPLVSSHDAYKSKRDFDGAIEIASECEAWDWGQNAIEWLKRRQVKAQGGAV